MLLSVSSLLLPVFTMVLSMSMSPLISASSDHDRMMKLKGEIEDVCRYTQDANYCVTALKSQPGSAGADLHGLAKIAVELANKTGQDANIYTMSLIRKGSSGSQLQQRYLLCSERIVDGLEEIREAAEDLISKDYIDVCSAALDATEEAQSCQDEFEMPPQEPSQLPQFISNFVTLSSAIFFIAGRLIKKT